MQENLEDNFEIKKTLGNTFVGITMVRLTSVQENRGGRPDAATPAADVLGSMSDQKLCKFEKNTIQKSSKNDRENLKETQKGFQNEAEIDSQSNQKPMPKQVSTNIMKIMKSSVFLMCKSI